MSKIKCPGCGKERWKRSVNLYKCNSCGDNSLIKSGSSQPDAQEEVIKDIEIELSKEE